MTLITWQGTCAWNSYWSDSPTIPFCRQHLSYLDALGRRADRVALLEKLCAQRGCHPVFWQHLAAELSRDARTYPCGSFHAARLAVCPRVPRHVLLVSWRAVAATSFRSSVTFESRGGVPRRQGRAVCESLFCHGRYLKATEKVLTFLRTRVQRFGLRTGQPVATLFWALEELNRTEEAFSVLDEALQRRTDDHELKLFAADAFARHGKLQAAERLLDGSQTVCA